MNAAELDREAVEVLRELAAERLAQRAPTERPHDPCRFCGLGSSPSWRGPSTTGQGLTCGRCQSWFDMTHTDDIRLTRDPLDIAAAALAGLATPTYIPGCRGLADAVGLTPFSDTGLTEPNSTPWGHVDVRALREKVVEVARTSTLVRLPPKWNPNARVSW